MISYKIIDQMRIIYLANRWPNVNETAASTRSLQIIYSLKANGCDVTIACVNPKNAAVKSFEGDGIKCVAFQLNDQNFKHLLKQDNYNIAFFDTFLMEEKTSWMFQDVLPDCLTVLDTQDLHFLREARSEKPSFKASVDELNFDRPKTYRELASIYRCDLSLIISWEEFKLLKNHFNVDKATLMYLPFMFDPHENKHDAYPFKDREGILMLGNFLHAPNLDQAVFFIDHLNAALQEKIHHVEVFIAGAFPTDRIIQKSKHQSHIKFLGYQEDLMPIFNRCKLMISPLRFGAGLKGKLFDAINYGLPFVGSEIACEGLFGLDDTFVAKNNDGFVAKTATLYKDEGSWQKAQFQQSAIVKTHFDKNHFASQLTTRLTKLHQGLKKHRENNYQRNLILRQAFQAHKYFSKWIELKNQIKNET